MVRTLLAGGALCSKLLQLSGSASLLAGTITGNVTPPFGMNLFYLRGILDQIKGYEGCGALQQVAIRTIWAASFPDGVIMYVGLALVLLFPKLALRLPMQMS